MNMTWSDFYLICFLVGLALTVFSLFVGVFKIDFPGRWDNFLHMGHGFHGGHGHFHAGHAHDFGHGVSPFNFTTIMAFLTWFGGTGYLMSRHTTLWSISGLALSILSGLVGGGIVFWFMAKLMQYDHTMDPADSEMRGTVGSITSPVRPNGVGEMVYIQAGARKSVAVRSANGREIAIGEEVAITDFEDGVAYVRRWSELEEER
jgi:membrane protein implicated in regulation of membrane protease activity